MPALQGVRFCEVSARRELNVYQSAFTQTSIRLSLFSKDVKVEQSLNSSGCLFHKLAALNINERCPCDCLILGNSKFLLLFFVFCFVFCFLLDCAESSKLVGSVAGQQTI